MAVPFIHIIIAIIAFKSVLLAGQESVGPASASSQGPILADVQDRLDTLDQAGLYVLLQRLLESPESTRSPVETVDPKELLATPAKYRGNILRYPSIVYRQVSELSVAKKIPSDCKNLFSVIAKVPYGNELAYPAVVILTERPEQPVDRATIEGYFYMILRSQTQKRPSDNGPAVLDYLVFVADRLLPAEDNLNENLPSGTTPLWWSGSGLAVLAVVWVWLRWKIRSQNDFLREIDTCVKRRI